MRKLKLPIVVALVAAALIGGVFLVQRARSEPGCAGKSPCMLYFYADW
jgi:hypothetical protein